MFFDFTFDGTILPLIFMSAVLFLAKVVGILGKLSHLQGDVFKLHKLKLQRYKDIFLFTKLFSTALDGFTLESLENFTLALESQFLVLLELEQESLLELEHPSFGGPFGGSPGSEDCGAIWMGLELLPPLSLGLLPFLVLAGISELDLFRIFFRATSA